MSTARSIGTTLAAAVLALTSYAGTHALGPVPPLGPLLDPAHGVWRARTERASGGLDIPGLTGTVEVRYDARGVPHIFATNELDAYRALGYVVARDRLFQIELQARAGSGRLTELVGAAALGTDSLMRALGLPRAAERKLAALDSSAPSRQVLSAYADGVNAYIDALQPAQYPVEYKLLNARPRHWQPIDAMYLLNRMTWTLASSIPEEPLYRAAAIVGMPAATSIFPQHTPIQEPIEPVPGWTAPHDIFAPVVPPGKPDTASIARVAAADAIARMLGRDVANTTMGPGLARTGFASNNWAVAPRRTQDRHALLAGDPHLQLTLPSIWYEVHLVVPGTLDVYGVTIPGAPAIVIGFNRDVAWTFTNTGADVIDLYRETVDDTLHPARYLVDGAWRPLDIRIERILDQHGNALQTDTMRYTYRGPMQRSRELGGAWVSMRWTAYDPSDELGAFDRAAHAHNVREFEDAMADGFYVPAQNMLAADRSGSIAIRSTGHFPIRPDNGDGRHLRDGAKSANDWNGNWPLERYPQSFNPAQGFLASANQEPEAPSAQYAYLGADPDYEVWRALRINQLLRSDSAVTPDAMRRWQTDPGSVRADRFVPYFLAAARTAAQRHAAWPSLELAARVLAAWDRRYTRDNTGAVLFEAAMQRLNATTWDELLRDGWRVATPTDAVLAELLTQPKNRWWDVRSTREVEDRDDVLAASLAAAYDATVQRYGPPERGRWRWDHVQFANIYHVLRIPGFSMLKVPVQGGRGTLSPSYGDGEDGPSWRMVVQLGPEVHGWGIYPGGQSGDPLSGRYTDRLQKWENGELDPLYFPRTLATFGAASGSLTLTPRGGAR